MSFRERSAWIALFAYGLVFGGYFAALAHFWNEPGRGPFGAAMLFGAIIALIVVVVALTILSAVISPRDANASADERERMIELKAERIGSYALSAAVVCLIGALLIGWEGFLVANLLLAAMVVAELAKAGAQIAYFRWGA